MALWDETAALRDFDPVAPQRVRSGNRTSPSQCPLYPPKRTNRRPVGMSALCQKRTNALQQKHVATRRPVNWLCLVQIDDLDPIAIGVVKIGVPAGERGVALVGIFDEFDATRLHDCERPIEFLRRYHESMMMSVFAGIVRIDVMGDLCQHEVAATAFHERIALVRAQVPAADDFGIEPRGGDVIVSEADTAGVASGASVIAILQSGRLHAPCTRGEYYPLIVRS